MKLDFLSMGGGAAPLPRHAIDRQMRRLDIKPLDVTTAIYAKDGTKNVRIASFYTQNRELLKWDDITPIVKNAAIAGEDVRYYEHGGVDATGVVRALVSKPAGRVRTGRRYASQKHQMPSPSVTSDE